MASSSKTDAISISPDDRLQWQIAADSKVQVFPTTSDSTAEKLNLEAAIEKALNDPIDFFSLDQAVVPDDTLVFAVDSTIPQLTEVVPAVLCWFAKRGTSPHNMSVVLAGGQPALADELRQALASSECSESIVQLHEADDPECVAYVAANEDSAPIYVNRPLVDADVVIPISCARRETSLDYFGVYSSFPLLSDRQTRTNFYDLAKLSSNDGRSMLRKCADQAAWWLGLVCGIQIIPTPSGEVAEVLAGLLQPLEQASQEAMSSGWEAREAEADIVVAIIDCGASQQDWLSFSRALCAASRFVSHGGSVVVCSKLSGAIGGGLKRLTQSHKTSEEIAKQLATDKYDDSVAAAVILEAVSDGHVYLVSNLRKDSVENLGIGAIESEEQLNHLIGQHDSCIILKAAQFM